MSIFAWIYAVFEFLLFLCHLSVLILIIAKRRIIFKGPFFNIFRTVLIADFANFMTITFGLKLSTIPFIKDYLLLYTYPGSILQALFSFFSATQFFGHLFLAINRFSLIWFPFNYENIWKRQWYTLVILGIPFLNVSWRLHESALFIFDGDKTPYLMYPNKNVFNTVTISTTTINLSTTCLAAIFNVLACIKFFMRKQNHSSINVNERNLLYVSLVIFFAQLMRISYNLCQLFFSSNLEVLLFYSSILPYLNDIFAWSGSISFWILSSSTRKAYKSFYFCKKSPHTITPSNYAGKITSPFPVVT